MEMCAFAALRVGPRRRAGRYACLPRQGICAPEHDVNAVLVAARRSSRGTRAAAKRPGCSCHVVAADVPLPCDDDAQNNASTVQQHRTHAVHTPSAQENDESRLRAHHFTRLPEHVAIVMDGNGRWAELRGLKRAEGHKEGLQSLIRVCRWCKIVGVKKLTVFAFSKENWKRPPSELKSLRQLLNEFMAREPVLSQLIEQNVLLEIRGDLSEFGAVINAMARRIAPLMEHASIRPESASVILRVALNYGATQEIVECARKLAVLVSSGLIKPYEINETIFAEQLELDGTPPDLIIRTGGCSRLSNFMLYQAAYAELAFVDDLWPEFSVDTLLRCLEKYESAHRKFGGLG
ncbi:Isoprenyl transferase [Porphyridium purpureum]|uniref:Alkyl transferase n=1 Tax=Porphyridium purpureum TaxID=35688 RepID=A0A5J4Z419_PORPP|nr:Isoprenyl transferase [Porphyridium purpureum]|eukprot:POR1054..scf295_1